MIIDSKPFLTQEKEDVLNELVSQADFADHLIGRWMLQLMTSVELHSVESLVFGSPGELWWKDKAFGNMLYGTFYEREITQIIEPSIQLFLMLFLVGLSAAILYSTLKVGVNPHNAYNRVQFAESIRSWFLAGLFFASYPVILDFLFGMNEVVRGTFYEWASYRVNISYVDRALFQEERVFGSLFLALVEFGLVAYLNAIYMFRKFLLLLLIILGPVIGICLFFNRLRFIAGRWMLELAVLTLIQSVHAILLFTMAKSIGYSQVSAFATLCWLALLIPISGMIQGWMTGFSASTGTAHALMVAGWGSMVGVSQLARESVTALRSSERQSSRLLSHEERYTTASDSHNEFVERMVWGGVWRGKEGVQSDLGFALRRTSFSENEFKEEFKSEKNEADGLIYNRWASDLRDSPKPESIRRKII